MKFHVLALISICVFLGACNWNKKQDSEKDEFYDIINKTLNTKINLPTSLEMYNPFNIGIDSVEIANTKYKIYFPLNASCSSCILNLERWMNQKEILQKDVVLIPILKSKDSFDYFKKIFPIEELRNFPYPVFFDNIGEWKSLNPFMKYSKEFETILTDNNNNILLLGNPLESKKTKELYVKVIEGELDVSSFQKE